MDKLAYIGIQNFRVFEDYHKFDFAPMTILTGKNSSGKSSVMKLLSLVRENLTKEHGAELPWELFSSVKDNHKLGGYSKYVNSNSGSDQIVIKIPTKIAYFNEDFEVSLAYERSSFKLDKGVLTEFKITYNNTKDILAYWNKTESFYNISFICDRYDHLIEVFEKDPNSDELYLPIESEVTEAKTLSEYENQIKKTFPNNISSNVQKELERDRINYCFDWGFSLEHTIYHHFNYDKEHVEGNRVINSFFESFWFKYSTKLPNHYNNVFSSITSSYKNSIGYYLGCIDEYVSKNLKPDKENQYNYLSNNYHLEYATELIEAVLLDFDKNLNRGIDLSFNVLLPEKINYLPSLRSSKDRFINIEGNNNLSQLLTSLEDTELFQRQKHNSDNIWIDEKLIFINHWLKEFEIGELIPRFLDEGNFLILEVKTQDGTILNLSDLGFGYSQLIPILLSIYNGGSIIMIEEPEANLHPNLQSKLADCFIDAMYRFNIHWIIETHSEYFIRKIQYWTAKNIICPQDSIIYYFNNPNKIEEGEKQIKKITIDKYGGLSDDFGKGFIDEATNLKFQLLRFNKSQQN